MPSVRILNGPNRDQLFTLRGGESVGRDPNNAIQVVAPGVSRRHFQFVAENGQFFVTDLGSSNGTYVNTIRITKHQLIENDTITVGGVTLLYSKSDKGSNSPPPVPPPPPPPAATTPSGGRPGVKAPAAFSTEEAPIGVFNVSKTTPPPKLGDALTRREVVLKDDSGGEGSAAEDYSLDASIVFSSADVKLPQKDQIAALQKRLKLMFEISQALGAIKDRDELLGKIMEQLFEIFPQADRGFILVGTSVEDLHPAVVRHRKTADSTEVQISRTIARKVYGEKQAILSQNAMEDDRFSGGMSILNFRILSMMVAPLLYRDEVYGFIHLDTQDRAKKFTPDDLNLLAGLAANAAIFLKNLKLFESVADEAAKRANLSRFFSKEVADKVASGQIDLKLGGSVKQGTVFFSDIVGFTPMSEGMEASALVTKINRYFRHMVDIIVHYKGTIDKFMGDAIMAVWNVWEPVEDDALNGMTAGIEMQNSVYLLNGEFLKEGEKEIHMGIGLNSGHFIGGNMGHEEKRMECTCIGDNVNLAQRLESKAGRGHVFVSESTFDRAKGRALAVRLKPTRVKGKAQPVTIYSIRGVVTPSREGKLFITSIPFKSGSPDGQDGLLIKAKLLGDDLVLGLCLVREQPKEQKLMMHFCVPELAPFSVPIDIQGEVPTRATTGKCLKGVFSCAGTPLQTIFNECVIDSDKSPEDIPRGASAGKSGGGEH